ncbi:MAG: tyrosine decarboxylase [Candidatus Aminicenantes bacterium]|nr:tyrosine decarboxylase [Candidatus Aminicenantes bacterium]
MNENESGVNFEAYFLGPNGENVDFYEELLSEALKNHVQWRQAFSLGDTVDCISENDKAKESFKRALKRIKSALYVLQEKLKKNQPFFSPRYIGHMNWEVMAAPLIAFFSAALYNPNNVAKAGSTGTAELELEVGKDFVKLFGFDEERGWGHICGGGSIANMEALWIARNMKVIPLVLKEMAVAKGVEHPVIDFTDEELLRRYSPVEILELKANVLRELENTGMTGKEIDELFDEKSLQARGLTWPGAANLGVVFLPETKHYSLKKSLDLLGLGWQAARYVPVDEHYRMDMTILEEMVFEAAEKHPVLAVIGIIGSTEESSVDEIHKIIDIRNRLQKEKNMSFHIHVDAAYGGYVRSIFLDEAGNFMNEKRLGDKLKLYGIIGDKEGKSSLWPQEEVYDAFKAMDQADTVTLDPHKLGYVLYPAGGIVMRDKRMREAIQTFAPYVFSRPEPGQPDELIGAYILEGSKPGAAAAAVWTAHRIMPLNISGYGKLIGETIDGALTLWHGLQDAPAVSIGEGVEIKVHPLIKPDINIVNYVFKFKGSSDLKKMNDLTAYIAEKILGYLPGPGELMLDKKYIVSTTDFRYDEYKDSPLQFLKKIGFSPEEWERVHEVKIIRSVIMSPYLTTDYVEENYVDKYIEYLAEEIEKRAVDLLSLYLSKES